MEVAEDPETGEVEYRDVEDAETFSLSEGPLPSALVYLGHQPAALEVAAERVGTGEVVEWAREDFVGRSPGPDDTFAVELARFAEEVPGALEPGEWVLEIRVLKALGDEADPEHWESWRSPAFTLVA